MLRKRHLILSLAILISCAKRPVLEPFTSDGCSLFPDADSQRHQNWCPCCIEHDYAYWQGGPESARLQADQALEKCILQSTGDSALASMIYTGTRVGGSPSFPTWYRWGYGWPYSMKPIPDTLRLRLVKEKSNVDLTTLRKNICPN
jgi:hypothetical protein